MYHCILIQAVNIIAKWRVTLCVQILRTMRSPWLALIKDIFRNKSADGFRTVDIRPLIFELLLLAQFYCVDHLSAESFTTANLTQYQRLLIPLCDKLVSISLQSNPLCQGRRLFIIWTHQISVLYCLSVSVWLIY